MAAVQRVGKSGKLLGAFVVIDNNTIDQLSEGIKRKSEQQKNASDGKYTEKAEILFLIIG